MSARRSFLLVLLLIPALLAAQTLAVGDPAPDFTLRYATKDSIPSAPLRLSEEWKRSTVVLAFYPADWSSGCTREVCAFRDGIEGLTRLSAVVLPISGDYVYSHHEWAKFHGLPFKLLSDHDHAMAKAYASYNEATGYNRRTVYVVGLDGRIAYIDQEYNVRDDQDFQRLREALERLLDNN